MDSYLWERQQPGSPVPVTVGPTPFVYTNNSNGLQLVAVSGGVVALIEINIGAGFLPAIGIAGVYALFPSQQIRLTYVAVAPTVTTVQIT